MGGILLPLLLVVLLKDVFEVGGGERSFEVVCLERLTFLRASENFKSNCTDLC